MNKLSTFLLSIIDIILFIFLSVFIFLIVFLVFNLNIDYYLLAVEIIIFISIIFIVIKYILFNKELSNKNKIELLKKENIELKNKYENRSKDIQDYFLTWVHQIKTPITAAKLLIEKSPSDSYKIKKELFYIEEYTNSALNYLKLFDHHQDLDLDKVKLEIIIKQIVKKFSVAFIDNKLSLNLHDLDIDVIGDAMWLTIAIEQLISNAVKYTKNGNIEIYFKHNTLYIKDNGKGIKKEDLSKIFNCGYGGFNGRLNQKSSGIGLYLVKNIADKINIEVKIDSELSKGTIAKLIFPNDVILQNSKND